MKIHGREKNQDTDSTARVPRDKEGLGIARDHRVHQLQGCGTSSFWTLGICGSHSQCPAVTLPQLIFPLSVFPPFRCCLSPTLVLSPYVQFRLSPCQVEAAYGAWHFCLPLLQAKDWILGGCPWEAYPGSQWVIARVAAGSHRANRPSRLEEPLRREPRLWACWGRARTGSE